MNKIFINSSGQLRSGWKIAAVVLLFLILSNISSIICVAVPSIFFLVTKYRGFNYYDVQNSINKELAASGMFNFVYMAAFNLSMILAVLIALKFIDRERPARIGLNSLKANFKDFCFGLFLGAVSIALIFFVLLFTGNISLKNDLLHPEFSSSLIIGLISYVFVGLSEEMFSRGYCMTVLKQTQVKWVPLVISSLIFSLAHGLNPNVSAAGLLNIFLAGMLFGVMFIETDSLWMPIGYHITWNFFQGKFFSFPVSGNASEGVYKINVLNNNLLTGGDFGPEGGILTTLVILIGFFAVLKFKGAGKKKNFSLSRWFAG